MEEIKDAILQQLSQRLTQSGIMFRIFGRAKSLHSLEHKMDMKGEKYISGDKKIQDVIGIRIVLYFVEDIEALEMFLCDDTLVDHTADNLDPTTFRPKRLNLVKKLPQNLVEPFRQKLNDNYARYIDDTYEIQIRTVFSEGWHEVEHDLRYKCQDDWEGCDVYTRQLNGVLATLETAQWTMGAIFREMAYRNYCLHNYNAMMRNKMMLRFADEQFSPAVLEYLNNNSDVARRLLDTDRVIVILTLLNHKGSIPLTYDNILFLVNRFDIMDEGICNLESPETKEMINAYLFA